MTSFRTAESVSPKHPDKLCDQVSDALLDAYLVDDPMSRTAIEVVGGHGRLFITGEVGSSAKPDIEAVARRIVGDDIEITVHIAQQSSEIAHGVDAGGAGDQGIMVGYACDETPQKLPLDVVLSRDLNQYLYRMWPYDGKTQVTLLGDELYSIVASFQNAPGQELEEAVRQWARQQKYVSSCFVKNRPSDPSLHINPAGDWRQGGFDADAGLTGRKLVVDNYGPRIPIGGGCFSGKDGTKVDRSGAYMARKIAIDYLGRFQAKEVFCYLAYAIGYDQPIEATAVVDGTFRRVEGYDLTPAGVIRALELRRPRYEATARYGHFGHAEFAWES